VSGEHERVGGAGPLQRLGEPEMLRGRVRRELGVQRLGQKRVREAPRGAHMRIEQAGCSGLLERLGERASGHGLGLAQQARVELDADRRSGAEQPPGPRGQRRGAPLEQPIDAERRPGSELRRQALAQQSPLAVEQPRARARRRDFPRCGTAARRDRAEARP
jgi:hypothetical protein